MENRIYERQQLVMEEEETGGGVGGGPSLPLSLSLSPSPAASSSMQSNRATQPTPPQGTTRVAYLNERRPVRGARRGAAPPPPPPGLPPLAPSSSTTHSAPPPQCRRTQADLLRLLAEFGSPGASRATQQLADIRQQQDDLARLHFKLGSDPDAPAKPTSARETMARLVRSLEQLSTSIEQLHTLAEPQTAPDASQQSGTSKVTFT